MKIMVINGVNMNMLGTREKDVYGENTLEDLYSYIRKNCSETDTELDFFQSNHEGDIVDCLHRCFFEKYDGVVINPAAHTHYSYAIRDAIKAIMLPVVEVHISAIDKREEFRHVSVTAPVCRAQICGKGFDGYVLAVKMIQSGKYEDIK